MTAFALAHPWAILSLECLFGFTIGWILASLVETRMRIVFHQEFQKTLAQARKELEREKEAAE